MVPYKQPKITMFFGRVHRVHKKTGSSKPEPTASALDISAISESGGYYKADFVTSLKGTNKKIMPCAKKKKRTSRKPKVLPKKNKMNKKHAKDRPKRIEFKNNQASASSRPSDLEDKGMSVSSTFSSESHPLDGIFENPRNKGNLLNLDYLDELKPFLEFPIGYFERVKKKQICSGDGCSKHIYCMNHFPFCSVTCKKNTKIACSICNKYFQRRTLEREDKIICAICDRKPKAAL